eukprot:TRINITY_DN982_c0_g1_i7.p1 TRINITY_DN982_c0_g1~~TRINITY_DN982_c0_g1_i7.p1  ORF type:complete len:152 (+),score=46.58 TRINITY_DN982_c0_g1_i7:349-804(+)
MQLVIRVNKDCPDICLKVEANTEVLRLRKLISKQIKASLKLFYLCYDQEIMEDDYTLEDYGVQEGATIYCALRPADDNSILLRLENGEATTVVLNGSDSVQKLKRVVGEKVYGKRCRLQLVYDGVNMADNKLVKDYGVKRNDEVKVIRPYV